MSLTARRLIKFSVWWPDLPRCGRMAMLSEDAASLDECPKLVDPSIAVKSVNGRHDEYIWRFKNIRGGLIKFLVTQASIRLRKSLQWIFNDGYIANEFIPADRWKRMKQRRQTMKNEILKTCQNWIVSLDSISIRLGWTQETRPPKIRIQRLQALRRPRLSSSLCILPC